MTRSKPPLRKMFKNSHGFALVIIAVLLLLAGAAIISLILVSSDNDLPRTIKTQNTKIKTIHDALIVYYNKNSSLPKPASRTALPGTSTYGTGLASCPNNATCSLSGNIWIGAVPVRDLSLGDDYELDDWGNRFTYAVDTSGGTGITLNDTSGSAKTVVDINGSTGTAGTASAVIISHGADGAGSYTRNGAANSVACNARSSNVNSEYQNCDNANATFISDNFNSTNYYDDLSSYILVPNKYLAVGGSGSPYAFRYNSSWTKLADPANIPASAAYTVNFSHNGNFLVFGTISSPYMFIYDARSMVQITNPASLPPSGVFNIAFSPDDSIAAMASTASPYITLYNTTTTPWTKMTTPSTLPTNSAYGVSFSPDGTRLALASTGSTRPLIIYNTSTWGTVSGPGTLPANNAVDVKYSPDGTRLVLTSIASPYMYVYNTSTWGNVSVSSPMNGSYGLDFSPDGTKLAVGGTVSPYLAVFDTTTWAKTTPSTTPPAPAYQPAWSLGGTYLSVAHQYGFDVYNGTTLARITSTSVSGGAYGVSFQKN